MYVYLFINTYIYIYSYLYMFDAQYECTAVAHCLFLFPIALSLCRFTQLAQLMSQWQDEGRPRPGRAKDMRASR